MRVILLKDVKGLGKKHDVQNVSEGYARNFLIPRKWVEIATPEELMRLAQKTAHWNREREVLLANLQNEATRLENDALVVKMKTGDKGEVFGSITAKTIDHALTEKGYLHAKTQLPHAIKTLGSFSVEIDFGEGIRTALTVRAVKE